MKASTTSRAHPWLRAQKNCALRKGWGTSFSLRYAKGGHPPRESGRKRGPCLYTARSQKQEQRTPGQNTGSGTKEENYARKARKLCNIKKTGSGLHARCPACPTSSGG